MRKLIGRIIEKRLMKCVYQNHKLTAENRVSSDCQLDNAYTYPYYFVGTEIVDCVMII